jgi:hypothetical protein
MDIHVPKRVSSVATTYYGTLEGIAREYQSTQLLTLSLILTSTEKRWLERDGWQRRRKEGARGDEG